MEVILTHEHADFDALASLLAASKLFPEALPVLPHTLNRNLRDFLVLYRSALPFRRPDELPRRAVDQAIFVDTQRPQAVRGMMQGTPVRIIDHHGKEHDLPANYHYWGDSVGATTTLLVEQMISRGIPITPIEATLLLLGIYEDTGGLSYMGTTPRDMLCAAWLLERGANLEVVNDFLHHPLTPSQQRLLKQLGDAAETLEIAGQAIVIATARTAEPVEEISTLAHKLRDLYDPDGLFLLVDLEDRVQFVARSTTSHINVEQIAQQLGGGGHPRAAAALIRGQPLAAVRAHLLDLLTEHVRPPVTVRKLMSWGVNTVGPDESVDEVAQRMRRLGHEGFPVAENGNVVGLITRREIDRAVHHNLGKSPVRRVMREGQTTVGIDDSVQTLQKKMIEAGWGQVPVVDDQGQMVGIVTRTDLLKLWTAPEDELTPPSVALRMEAALPEGLLNLVRLVGQEAAALNYPLFVVGGFVRDLLLGFPNLDIDLVVEGDAATLARALAAQYGGRVRAHKQFGTAKWIREDAAFAASTALPDDTLSGGSAELAERLDFAAARTEFYEEATALPVVERSSIKLDLHRRDFTINTLAVRLDGAHWGELLDFYGGQRDLEAGIIRVLHSLSFVEDPTRILRAVRFEQRFSFNIEPRTQQLIADAIDLLPRVSGPRIRHEFDLIFSERQPENTLRRLHQLRVLQAIDSGPGLARRPPRQIQRPAGRSTRAALATRRHRAVVLRPVALSGANCRPAPPHGLSAGQQPHARPHGRLRTSAVSCARTGSARPAGVKARPPAAQNRRWRPTRRRRRDRRLASCASACTSTSTICVRCALYLDGERLRALGIKPGPIYRLILQEVRAARLDGFIHTESEEEALARQIIQREEHNS